MNAITLSSLSPVQPQSRQFRSLRFQSSVLCTLLLICLPACGGGGGGGGGGDSELVPDLTASTFQVTPAFGTPADGLTPVEIEVRLINSRGQPIVGAEVALEVTGFANVVQPLPPTDGSGATRTQLASPVGERKRLTAQTMSGGRNTVLGSRSVDFLLIPENTFFVRASGSDANGGRSPRDAWQSLARALLAAEVGSVIHVGGGIHATPLPVQFDASSGNPLVISGDRSGVMTGDPGEVVIDGGGAACALSVLGSRNVVLQGLTLRAGQCGLGIENSGNVRVLDCRMQENDFGLVVANADDLLVQDCGISANRRDGVRIRDARRTRLENNRIYANLSDGAVLLTDVDAVAIRFNTFFRNAGHHVRETQAGGAGAIVGNILAEGGEDALLLATGSSLQILDNLVWGNAGQSASTPPQGFFEADPLFFDPDGRDGILGGIGSVDDDFRVRPGSAANDIATLLARDVMLGSQQSLATRTTRSDDQFEWSGDDQPAANLGFHAALPEGPYQSITPKGGRILHAVPGSVRAQHCGWEREQPNALAGGHGPTLEAEIVFLEQRLSPLDSPEELVAAQVHSGTRGRILVRHFDGRRWSEAALAPFQDDIAPGECSDRRFDLEYEQLSGRALLVLADADGHTNYRVLERGHMSVEQPVADALPGAGRVRWVELVSRSGSDELALVTLDDQGLLLASLWNGTSWSSPHQLETSTVFTAGWRPFDAAFESLSGDLLVMWGFNTFSEETRWASLERASGQWRSGQHPSADTIGADISIASDPSSDRIAVLMGEGDFDDDVGVSVWDGGAWGHTAELTLSGSEASRMLELSFIGSSGIACVAFRRDGHTGSFNIALLLAHGWRIQPDVVLPGVGPAAKLRLVSLPDQGQLLGAVMDEQGNLFGLRYDGQAFTLLNGGAPLATGFDPAAAGRPFDVATRR